MTRLPLRLGLVLTLVTLAGLGLLISDIAVTKAMQSSLLSWVDHDLMDETRKLTRPDRPPPPPPPPPPNGFHPPTRFFLWIRDVDGNTVRLDNHAALVDGSQVSPALPNPPATTPVTVGSEGGAPVKWRIVTGFDQRGSVTVAAPLNNDQETVTRLIVLQISVGLVVLGLLGAAAFLVIRRSLRPLREVEHTAAAIAAGDLNRRVPLRGNRTEVDKLAQALNVMLARIHEGITVTEASEASARQSEAKMRRFVADAGHELRTPLTSIRGFAELHRQGALTDTETLMDRIGRESERMSVLVEDLLTLAKLDAQRPLDRNSVDLLEVAGDVVHSARASAPHRVIDLDVAAVEETFEVLGDRARLHQVLANLVGNATTHTPPEATVTVRLTSTKDHVRIAIADDGPGLSLEDLDKVFERFYRGEKSRTRAAGGTGLGLSIVKSLVEAHGGTVRVESAPGAGAAFTVDLPRC
ncbi:MAG: HAMP domain-containing histidine kinase [Mycobacteriaceae bacterium]|nr:HAMP domain-containing histidine kinase [Mycobacteriaceae bacterium]